MEPAGLASVKPEDRFRGLRGYCGERVRIISARFAEPQERRRYHEENS
jgi:uncharacterized DUF497 family protein